MVAAVSRDCSVSASHPDRNPLPTRAVKITGLKAVGLVDLSDGSGDVFSIFPVIGADAYGLCGLVRKVKIGRGSLE